MTPTLYRFMFGFRIGVGVGVYLGAVLTMLWLVNT